MTAGKAYGYELSWDAPSILLRTSFEAFAFLCMNQDTMAYIARDYCALIPGCLYFYPPGTQQPWGFSKVLMTKFDARGIRFSCILPSREGKSPEQHKAELFASAASLAVLFDMFDVDSAPRHPDSEPMRAISVQLVQQKDVLFGTASIVAELSTLLMEGIGADTEYAIDTVRLAMQQAWTVMGGPQEVRIGAAFHPPRGLYLSVPGSVCGFGPTDEERDIPLIAPPKHVVLFAEQLDGPLQQLTLLAGLASLGPFTPVCV